MTTTSHGMLMAAGGLLAVALVTPAAAQSADEGRYVPAAQLQAMVAKAPKGVVTVTVPTGPGATVLIARRTEAGEVEVHEHLNDEFVARTGHATVRVGGKVTGDRRTAPGEWRGGAIAGGRSYQLAPGDVLWIPAGAPHQVTPKGGAFSYLAFKYEAKPAAATK
jgi:mannose-6-phosphate isomerase-like protein (cupin superfamily)